MTAPIPPAADHATDRKQARRSHAKSTVVEYEKRVELVRQLLLSGAESHVIVRNVSENYGVTTRMVEKYIQIAKQRILVYSKEKFPFIEAEMIAEHISLRRDIRRRAREAGDLKAELAAARDEAQLIGLYAPTKIAPTTPDGQSEWRIIAEKHGLNPEKVSKAVKQFRAMIESNQETKQEAPQGEKDGE
jgi:hypothetical protein